MWKSKYRFVEEKKFLRNQTKFCTDSKNFIIINNFYFPFFLLIFIYLPNFYSYLDISHSSLLTIDKKCTCNKIIIADDDGFDAMALKSIVSSYEIGADIVYNGVDCLKLVNDKKDNKCGDRCEGYRLILMDCNMPMMNGLECTKRIK